MNLASAGLFFASAAASGPVFWWAGRETAGGNHGWETPWAWQVPPVAGWANRAELAAVVKALTARDGKDALSKMTGQKIHLIISDVNMPNMDGIAFVKEVKKLPNYKFTPIIMLTTESQEAKKQEGQAAGAKAWVVKPFKPEQMLMAVSKLILP